MLYTYFINKVYNLVGQLSYNRRIFWKSVWLWNVLSTVNNKS